MKNETAISQRSILKHNHKGFCPRFLKEERGGAKQQAPAWQNMEENTTHQSETSGPGAAASTLQTAPSAAVAEAAAGGQVGVHLWGVWFLLAHRHPYRNLSPWRLTGGPERATGPFCGGRRLLEKAKE